MCGDSLISDTRKTCYQKTIREKVSSTSDYFGTYDSIDTTSSNATVSQISYTDAKQVITQYEWLGTMPAGAFLCTALKYDGHIAAVECFTETKPGGYYTLFKEPCTLLARGCCVYWAPPYASTYLISQSLKLLEKHYEGRPRYVLAYSDWDAGELGTVYQASNWIYLGHKYRREWRSPEGKRFDPAHHRDLAKSRDPDFKTKRLLNPEIVSLIKDELVADGWTIGQTMRGSYATTIGYKSKEKKALMDKLDEHRHPYPKTNILINPVP